MTYSQEPAPAAGSRLHSFANKFIGFSVLRGIIGILFGILVLASPSRATEVLTPFIGYVIALWLMTSGVLELVAALQIRDILPGWGWEVFFSAVTIALGIVLLFVPVGTGFFVAMLTLWCIAFMVLFRSMTMMEVGRGWVTAAGIIYAIFAVLMIWFLISDPSGSVEALVWIAGFWGLVSGIFCFIFAWQIQRTRTSLATTFNGQY